jgi:PhnB protein
MKQLNAYLQFNGNCREAMTFYEACLGGKLTLQTIGESQMAAQMPAELHNNILHSSLDNGHISLMAADSMGADGMIKGNMIALCVVCSTKSEIQSLYAKLSAGGQIGHPLNEEFFGTFGDFTDKFGISWMLQLEPNAPA